MDDDASNNGIGTSNNPLLGITQTMEGISIGDTVIVYPGTYNEDIDYQGKNIVLASRILETGDEAYIDSTIIQGTVLIDDGVDSTGLFSGFTITGDFTSRGLTVTASEKIIINNIKLLNVGGALLKVP